MTPSTYQRTAAPKMVRDALDKFLATAHRNDGSHWTPVDPKDVDALYTLIGVIIDLKWARDCDNDSSVRVHLNDRTRYRPDFWLNVPYGTENPKEAFEAQLYNLQHAVSEMNTTRRVVDAYVGEEESK